TAPTNQAQSSQPSEFGFTEIDPFVEPEPPSAPEPKLAPAATTPRLAPVGSASTRVTQRTALDDRDEADGNAGSGRRDNKHAIAERDGTAQIDRDRKVLTYGVSWTFFCLFVAAVISYANAFANAGEGASPGTFVPAMISIVIGWVIVFVAR